MRIAKIMRAKRKHAKKSGIVRVAVASLFAALSAIPLASYAKVSPATPVPVTPTLPPLLNGLTAPVHTVTGIIWDLNIISAWVAVAFWIFAAIMIFYAAFLYITAAGEGDRVRRASHALLYAVIGIIVGIMAYGLPLLLESALIGV